MKTRKDSIIEKIHAVRNAIAREANYDLEAMLEAARARQKTSGRQAVRLPPREAELEELVRGITPKNRHEETDFGPPVGREIL
jgi:hypothetical protein